MLLLFIAQPPPVGQGRLISSVHDHTETHHSRKDSPLLVISLTQNPLPDNTQRSQCPGWFEPTISAIDRQQIRALDRTAAGIIEVYSKNRL